MDKYNCLIGVTPWYSYDTMNTYVKYGYMEGISKAKGLGVLLPLSGEKKLIKEIVHRFDGFILSGGPDIDASFYNEPNLFIGGDVSPERDFFEINLVKYAFERKKPVFGICRGIQVINVAFGGTLYQDLHAQFLASIKLKHTQQAPKWHAIHEVLIDRESVLYKTTGNDRIKTNSFHHQAVKEVAPGFKAVAWTGDGLIEAIESDDGLITGVQWHPELMWETDRYAMKLFSSFIEKTNAFLK